ncbi:pilus assembly protein [Nonomuraea phyllanthi]|uniref:TadE/TadG family type IV pilus assembly protein n=1 Tax=Nonomuraea phyllanthi TaxID=2219224 RepID=UPI001292FC57|nr:TadE/TadG family type IV pilus assembly protein [Nonomuraea phyllanthi]QFY06327.1 pilus assembly protein [Nonomuraea phyllanthi]
MRRPEKETEKGSMAVETVMLAPVFLLFLMFLAGAGVLVESQGRVNGAARDAARAASVQRTLDDAEAAAESIAEGVLTGPCGSPAVSLDGSEWEQGGEVQAEVTCELDLGFLGFGGSKRLTGTAVVPIEQFRRVE